MNDLRRFTMARVGLGRAGNALPTSALLDFQLAHARARDAVHFPLDVPSLRGEIEALGLPALSGKSAARDRLEYLRRPDLGRILGPRLKSELENVRGPFDIVFVIADGLSALAVHRHASAVLRPLLATLDRTLWRIAPVVIVEQGRVAIADEIGFALDAALSLILIGERPGLSVADSLGAYLTWSPRPGRIDAERNCVSNIGPHGLSPGAAAELVGILISESRAWRLSGVNLKLDSNRLVK